jgi:SET family sugar efflux transporter-like MFS transporter
VGGFVLLQATNAASVAIMTLFVRDGLGLAVTWAGAALGLAAGLEVPFLFLLGRLVGRFSSTALVASGCVAGVVYYGAMPFVTGPWTMLGLQVANAYFYAVVAGVGLTWFGEVIPGAAFAAGLYATTGRLGSIVSGGLIALVAVSPLGYATVFAVSAVLVAVVGALVVWAGVRDARLTKGRPRRSGRGSAEEPA